MSNPIILYDSRFTGGTLTATDTEPGFDIANIKDLRTYTFHKFASAGTKYITADCGSAKDADCLCILSHNLFSASATLSVESSADSITWVERLTGFVAVTNKLIFKTFTSASARYWRLKIVTPSIAAQIGVVMLGAKLIFPWPADSPVVPYQEGIESETNRSQKGHLLGSVINYKSIAISVKFSNLLRTWIWDNYKPFWEGYASHLKPFFFAGDIDIFPDMAYFVVVEPGLKFKTQLSRLNYVDTIELEMQGITE